MKAMILAAGEGTRLAPLTEHRPKPILPVLNRPHLSHTLTLLKGHGIDEAVVNLHHRARRMVETLGDGSPWGVSLTYSMEESLLGTAGAVKRAERHFEAPFLVLYGDNLFDFDIMALIREHESKGADCTIGLFRAPDPTAAGLVETNGAGRVLRFVEKPPPGQVRTDWANAGIYILDPALIRTIPADGPSDFGHHLFPRWIEEGVRIQARPIAGLIQDIGTPAGYLAAHRAGLDGRTPRVEAGWRAGLVEQAAGIWAAPGVRVDPAAVLVPPVLLGEQCRIERAARVGPYAVLGPECRVAEAACVNRSVMWYGSTVDTEALIDRSVVAAGASVGASAVLEDGVLVGEGARVPLRARPAAGARIRREEDREVGIVLAGSVRENG